MIISFYNRRNGLYPTTYITVSMDMLLRETDTETISIDTLLRDTDSKTVSVD